MKKCLQCDKRYDDSQKFCSDCGVELTDLSWEEQNQLIAEEQKAKTKKTGIIAIACVLVLAILIGAGVMMYPSMQVKAAISATEDKVGREFYSLDRCVRFKVDDAVISELDEYVIPGTYVCVWEDDLDIYFVRMKGLNADFIYDYDIFGTGSATDYLNNSFLAVFSALTEATIQEKAKDYTEKYQ